MYCRACLYDLSRTTESRCPECGMSFNPRNSAATTLPTSSRLAWMGHHAKAVAMQCLKAPRRSQLRYCRECFADLRGVVDEHCPVCNTWFNPKDSETYRRSNGFSARVWERFRHVCVWRGLLLPIIPLVIGLYAVIEQHTLLPGGGRSSATQKLMPLDGWPAVAMGCAWIGLAFALHANYFWGRVEPIWKFAGLGVVVGIMAILIGWGAALVWAFQNVAH